MHAIYLGTLAAFGEDSTEEGPTKGACETPGLLRRSALAWQDGRLETALRKATEATAVDCGGSHELCQLAHFWYVALLIKIGHLDAGRRALNAIEIRRDGFESPRVAAASHIVRGRLLFAGGHVDDAIAETETGLRMAERSDLRFLRAPCYTVMALGALRRADMRVCLEYVDRLAVEAQLGFGQAAGAWVTAQAMEARSGVTSAADLVSGIVTSPFVLRQLLVSEPAAASWLVRASGKLGDPDLSKLSVEAASAASDEHPRFNVIKGAALHATGLLEGDAGKLREAADLYPDRWCGASALEDLASLLTKRHSEKEEAVGLLETALGVYNTVGARRDSSRVASKLREFGVRRGAIRTVKYAGLLPYKLTKTEFAVAELVSQGCSNGEVGRQLFISRHTVAFHLKKVFQKMNIASRVELAATWKVLQ